MNFPSLLYLFVVSIAGMIVINIFPVHTGRIKFIAGPSLGIIIITELILILSLIFKFSQYSILGALYLFIALIFVIWRLNRPKLSFPGKLSFNAIFHHWPLLVILSTIGLVVFSILWTKILSPSSQGLLIGGEGLFGDTSMHSAFTMSIVEQGLPPTNPLFASIPLVYPFLTNLFSASLIKLGMNMRFAFILPQMIFFVGFTTLFYALIKRIHHLQNVSQKIASKATILSMLIFFLGWGVGFMNYFNDVQKTDSWVVKKEYTNNIPGFALHNVITGIILPARSFLPGIVIGMLITLLMISNDNHDSRKLRNVNLKPIVIGLLLGILPLWHTHTFIFFGISVGIWSFYLLFEGERELHSNRFKKISHFARKMILNLATIYGIAFVLALPVFIWSRTQVHNGSFIHFMNGWADVPIQSMSEFGLFWLRNTGLLIPLSILGMFLMKKQIRYVFFPAIAVFVIANFVSFQPWEWDNIKLFSWVFLFVSIPAGLTLVKISNIKIVGPLLTSVMLISLTFSGTLSLINLTQNRYTIYDNQDIELAEWVKANTPKDAVFLVDPWPNHPVPGLAGRSVYMGYPGHLWVHGIEYGKRESLINEALQGSIASLSKSEIPIDYVVTSSPNININLLPHFSNSKHTVFQVR